MKGYWITTLAALAIAACGDDNGGGGTDTSLTTIFPDGTSDTTPSDTSNPNAVRTLEFDLAFGDDMKPCRQQPRCSIIISYTESRPLKVVYTEDGQPVSGVTVKFAVESDPAGLAGPSTGQSVTDAEGKAQIAIRSKRPEAGQFAIKVSVEGGANPPAVRIFDVAVTPKGQVPLTVLATYGGPAPQFSTYSVSLYRQNAQGAPACTDLEALYASRAAITRDNTQLGLSAKFLELPGLEDDGTQKYTILAYAKNTSDEVVAWACNATDGTVELTKANTVEVVLADRPPKYVGVYDIVSKFNFVSAIPEPYRTYVDYVISFFQDPTGTILLIACDLLTEEEEELNSFCDLVFDDVGGDLQLTALGGFVADLLNAVIDGVAGDSIFKTIFQVGGDIAQILKEFELRGEVEFHNEPDATGRFAAGDAEQTWTTVRVKWTLGANCDPDTEVGCGTIQQSLAQFGYVGGPITGEFGASVADFYMLTIDKHSLNFHYGQLLSLFAETLLIPLIIHGTNRSEWTVNTYEELLQYLVGSGAACINPGSSTENCPDSEANHDCCCRKFADGVGNDNQQIDGGTEGAVSAACDVIVKTAPTFLRNSLQGLDVDTGDAFTLATKSACPMYDTNKDLIIDGFGKQSAPCFWDVVLKFGESTTVTIDSKFFAIRQEL